MRWTMVVVAGLLACGDDGREGMPDAGRDAGVAPDGQDPMGFFGEPCTVNPSPSVVVICHNGEGACHEENGTGVCRPFCYTTDIPQTETCSRRGGRCIDSEPSGSAYVCVP